MATKQLFAARDFKYGTRMLRAGEPVDMTAPHARLFRALGAVTDEKPKRAKADVADAAQVGDVVGVDLAAKPKAAPKRKAAPRKKKA